MIEVYFIRDGNHVHVANVDTNDLDEAWVICQNVDTIWVNDPRVELTHSGRTWAQQLMARAGCLALRSSMVGDRYGRDGRMYEVMPMGFEEV